jgi:hypothetical protein
MCRLYAHTKKAEMCPVSWDIRDEKEGCVLKVPVGKIFGCMMFDVWLRCVCCDFSLLVAGLRCVLYTPLPPLERGVKQRPYTGTVLPFSE